MKKFNSAHLHPHFSHHFSFHSHNIRVEDVPVQDFASLPEDPHLEPGTDTEYIRSVVDPWGSAQERLCIGSLDVEVLEAANLPAADFGFSSDPYCTLELTGYYGENLKRQFEWAPRLRLMAKTQVVCKTLSPVFRTRCVRFPVRRHGAALRLNIFDRDDIGTDDCLGHLTIFLNDLQPGEHEGWFLLHDPNDGSHGGTTQPTAQMMRSPSLSNDEIAGPAVRLRIVFRVSPTGEMMSFLWSSPQVVKPSPPRFDPNTFFGAAASFKAKVINTLSGAAGRLKDAISWKAPAFSAAVFGGAMLLCNFIEDFWVIFHGGLACFVVATGILTDAGAHDLVSPDELFDELQTTEDEASKPNSGSGSGSSSSNGGGSGSGNGKLFTGIKEMTLRKAGRTVGKPVAAVQATLVSASATAQLLENMITWRRVDMRLGFGSRDGSFMAAAFIVSNFFMCLVHIIFPLRVIALSFCALLFSMPALQRISKLMPQAIALWKERCRTKDSLFLPERPLASKMKRKNNREIVKMLRSIFRRVDVDLSGTVTLEEILKALPHLSSEKKEIIHDAVDKANHDGGLELNYPQFEEVILSVGNALARPLIVAELKRELCSHLGVTLMPSSMGAKRLGRSFRSSAPAREQDSPAQHYYPLILKVRVTDEDNPQPWNEGILYKRKGKMKFVAMSSIVHVQVDPDDAHSVILEHRKTGQIDRRLLVLSVHNGSIRDALLLALREVISRAHHAATAAAAAAEKPMEKRSGGPAPPASGAE